MNFNFLNIKSDLLVLFVFLPIAGIIGSVGLYGISFLIFGTRPPDVMLQPLPIWGAFLALVLFPITNALVELTTYFGYSMPRLEVFWKIRWLPLFLAAFWLSFQHTAFPLVWNWQHFLYRAISFIPFALAIGLIYTKTRRLAPLIIGHFFMDLSLVIFVWLASIK